MDISDVQSIEFLDLSEVEEHERSRVLSSLQKIDPSVQLPWMKQKKKTHYPDSRHNKTTKSIQNNTVHTPPPPMQAQPISVFNNIPMAIVTHNQQYEYTPVMPVHYVYQPNILPGNCPIYYNNSMPSPTYHAPVIYQIPAKPIEPVTFPASFGNNVPQQEVISVRETSLQRHSNAFEPVQGDVGANLSAKNVVEPKLPAKNDVEPKLPAKNVIEPILPAKNVQNGVQQPEPVAVAAEKPVAPVEDPVPAAVAPASKSWASLFNSSKKNSDVQPTAGAAAKSVVIESNNNEVSPFKNFKKTIYDPDCYWMGEFLIGYAVDGRTVSLQPRGLINQSNYCYVNSILQALIACPPMYNLMSALAQNITSNAKRKPTPVIDGVCRFVKEFNHLPAGQRVGRRQDKSQKKEQNSSVNCDMPFEASWIYKLLNGIRSDLIEGRQEDAEEFLGCLLNGLNDEMLELIKLVKSDEPEGQQQQQQLQLKEAQAQQQGANDGEGGSEGGKEWLVQGKKKASVTRRTDFDRTPISDIFGGFLKSRIHRAGDHDTENIQPFFTLQLNIEHVNSVSEALEALITKNQLEGITSSKTNEEVEAWQQVMIDELPVVLILHLKCFDFKPDGCKKIVKALEFPIDLKIDSKLLSKTNSQNKKQYKLFAVVYHDGKEASKGHYITDAFHVGYNSWLRYDDASVKPVSEEHVMKPLGTRVPYLLFYRRSDTIRSK